MMPAVPYFRYRAVFDELRPLLEEKGVRIGGMIPDAARENAAGLSASSPR